MPPEPHRLLTTIELLIDEARATDAAWQGVLGDLPEASGPSAANLLHYLALRAHDLRSLQDDLAALGLSSLGRLEPHVLPTLSAVRGALARLADPAAPFDPGEAVAGVARGREQLDANTTALLGPAPHGRDVRIMVTMPSDAATRYELVRDLVVAGMDVMRVNCAHDDAAAWGAMVDHLERARAETGRACRVHCDLAGPKVRTGPLPPGPAVVHLKPSHDALGGVRRTARVWLSASGSTRSGADATLVLGADFLDALRPSDRLRFVDARGRHREMIVTDRAPDGAWAVASKGAYLAEGASLVAWRGDEVVATTPISGLPRAPGTIRLEVGDTLVICANPDDARLEERDETGAVVVPARVGCTLPEVLRDAKVGDPILFDDGKIRGVVRERSADGLVVTVTHARAGGVRLAADKGINLPETVLDLPALTGSDLEDLDFVAQRADLVGLSFVRSPQDVEALQRELSRRGAAGLGIVLKVETRLAFERMPALLLQAMKTPPVGVMVARGDLGVEVGFERLAEVQEEMLWLGEAAHVPIVWATQVLETLTRSGLPSRAEVTDAAMGVRAECVMLNKGPYVAEAVTFLVDVLGRMSEHQHKKRTMLRRLSVAVRAGPGASTPSPTRP